ncbi:MAG TPA: hypothetical protein VF041_17395 [Gemmatimonadaceae bacterium]
MATAEDAPGDVIALRVVDDAAALPGTVEALHAALEPLERELDAAIEVRGATRADLDALPAADRAIVRTALPISGLPPGALVDSGAAQPPRVRTHADHDARARALGAAIAERLARDSSLVERARRQIARRMSEASPGERRELAEWDRLLRTRSTAQLRRLLVDPGEHATRLRHMLPFLSVLTPAEREAALASAGDTAGVGRAGRRTAKRRSPAKREAGGRRTKRRSGVHDRTRE